MNKYLLGYSGSLITCGFIPGQKSKIKDSIFNYFIESEKSN